MTNQPEDHKSRVLGLVHAILLHEENADISSHKSVAAEDVALLTGVIERLQNVALYKKIMQELPDMVKEKKFIDNLLALASKEENDELASNFFRSNIKNGLKPIFDLYMSFLCQEAGLGKSDFLRRLLENKQTEIFNDLLYDTNPIFTDSYNISPPAKILAHAFIAVKKVEGGDKEFFRIFSTIAAATPTKQQEFKRSASVFVNKALTQGFSFVNNLIEKDDVSQELLFFMNFMEEKHENVIKESISSWPSYKSRKNLEFSLENTWASKSSAQKPRIL